MSKSATSIVEVFAGPLVRSGLEKILVKYDRCDTQDKSSFPLSRTFTKGTHVLLDADELESFASGYGQGVTIELLRQIQWLLDIAIAKINATSKRRVIVLDNFDKPDGVGSLLLDVAVSTRYGQLVIVV